MLGNVFLELKRSAEVAGVGLLPRRSLAVTTSRAPTNSEALAHPLSASSSTLTLPPRAYTERQQITALSYLRSLIAPDFVTILSR